MQYTFVVYIRSDLRSCGLCIWLYMYIVSLIILLPGKKTFCRDLCNFWLMHMFGLPFSQLAVGGLCGNVDIFDACVRKQRYNGTFEFTYTTKSQVRCSVTSFSSFFLFLFLRQMKQVYFIVKNIQSHWDGLLCFQVLFCNSDPTYAHRRCKIIVLKGSNIEITC